MNVRILRKGMLTMRIEGEKRKKEKKKKKKKKKKNSKTEKHSSECKSTFSQLLK